MSRWFWIALLVIAACAGVTYEELEEEAMRTGDWSAVERWERREARREQLDKMSKTCTRQGLVLYCDNRKLPEYTWRECHCVSKPAITDALTR